MSLGHDPKTGKYRRVSRTVHDTKADARRVHEALLQEARRADEPAPPETTLIELVGV